MDIAKTMAEAGKEVVSRRCTDPGFDARRLGACARRLGPRPPQALFALAQGGAHREDTLAIELGQRIRRNGGHRAQTSRLSVPTR